MRGSLGLGLFFDFTPAICLPISDFRSVRGYLNFFGFMNSYFVLVSAIYLVAFSDKLPSDLRLPVREGIS